MTAGIDSSTSSSANQKYITVVCSKVPPYGCVPAGPDIHVTGVGCSGSHTLHRHHAFSSLPGRLGDVPSWGAPALNTSSNRERSITRQTSEHHQHPGGDFPSLDRSQHRPGDSISKENENCQARTCLKRRTLFTTHKHWL